MARQYYILLCYYPEYLAGALQLMAKFQAQFPELRPIIVDNSPNLKVSQAAPNIDVLPGDNTRGEFSGWQCALNAIMANESITDEDHFILANDTASRHRIYSFWDHYLFVQTFKRSFTNASIAGEVNHSLSPIDMAQTSLDRWISSYLFTLPGSFLLANQGHIIDPDLAYPAAVDCNSSGILFTPSISVDLANHINRWLFPEQSSKGWRSTTSKDSKRYIHKANMIYLEKSISLRAQNLGCPLVSVYERPWKKSLKRKLNRWYRRRLNA